MAFNPNRYERMIYRICGRTGLKLPAISLGFWHNFGDAADPDRARAIMFRAFDLGINHFDLANNYGPPEGSAERRFGAMLADLPRDEITIATKAGYRMGEGPYQDGGSRKYLISSCNASLARLGVDYVDLFYHHRPDLDTPLEESMAALEQIVRQGKALYAGISSYKADRAAQAAETIRRFSDARSPLAAHQIVYNLFRRDAEQDVIETSFREGMGITVFSPLAQGLLTDRYLQGIPEDSRAAVNHFLKRERVDAVYLRRAEKLAGLARARGQTLAQMALAWVLSDARVASAIVGASSVEQLEQNVGALAAPSFTAAERKQIDEACQAT